MWIADGLLAAMALAGHWTLVLFLYCRMYAHVTAKWMVWPTRLTFWAIAFVPPALVLAWWMGPGHFGPLVLAGLPPLVFGYLSLSWTALAYLLILSIRYRLKRVPAAQLANHSHVVDVTQQLGRRPMGTRAVSRLGRLPGNQVFSVQVVEKHLRFDRVPAAWRGLSIVQLSDLHADAVLAPEFYHECIRVVADLKPDMIVLTGDISDEPDHVPSCLGPLADLQPRYGKLAVLGNHDYWRRHGEVIEHLGDLGFTMLDNRVQVVDVEGHPLIVVGNTAPWCRAPLPSMNGELPDGFRLCLSHTPDNVPWARRAAIDLMLCGHVHGGQVRLPLVGSMYCPSRFGRQYDTGLFQEKPTLVYVNRGLSGSMPLRYRCRPEITRVVLYPGDQDPADID